MLGLVHKLLGGVGAGVSEGKVPLKAPDLFKPGYLLRKPVRVPPGSVLLFSTVKLAPLEDGFCADHAPIGSGKYRTMAKGPTLARYQKLFSGNYQRSIREPCGPYCVHYQDWKMLLE